MNTERSLIGSLTDEFAYKIFTDGTYYFIPGQREDNEFFGFFDELASKYFPSFDTGLGAGWLFDREAIEKIKYEFDHDGPDFVEIFIKNMTIHRHQ